jgi:anaerobic ribonucleoside-triphosphate reductase activating protein
MIHLSLHHRELSFANGPGLRFVIWTQGCTLGCSGCFNVATHPISLNKDVLISDLLEQVKATAGIEGVTITGGEPLEQVEAITEFLNSLPQRLTKVLYTGFTADEIFSDSKLTSAVSAADLTLAGRYQSRLEHPYLGKKIILSSLRVNPEYFAMNRHAEFIVSPRGITCTGLLSNSSATRY